MTKREEGVQAFSAVLVVVLALAAAAVLVALAT